MSSPPGRLERCVTGMGWVRSISLYFPDAHMIIYLFYCHFFFFFFKAPGWEVSDSRRVADDAERSSGLSGFIDSPLRGGSFILESLTPLRRSSEPSPRRATCCMPYIDEPGGERSVRGIFAQEPQAVFDALSPRFSPHPSPWHSRTHQHAHTHSRAAFHLKFNLRFRHASPSPKESHARARASVLHAQCPTAH